MPGAAASAWRALWASRLLVCGLIATNAVPHHPQNRRSLQNVPAADIVMLYSFEGHVPTSVIEEAVLAMIGDESGSGFALSANTGVTHHVKSYQQRFVFDATFPDFAMHELDDSTPAGRARILTVRQAISMALGIQQSTASSAPQERRRQLQAGASLHTDVTVDGHQAATVLDRVNDDLAGHIEQYLRAYGIETSRPVVTAVDISTAVVHSVEWELHDASERSAVDAAMDKLLDPAQVLPAVNVRAGGQPGATALEITVIERVNEVVGIPNSPPPPVTPLAASCGAGTVWDHAAALCMPSDSPSDTAAAPVTIGSDSDSNPVVCGPGTRWDGNQCTVTADGSCRTTLATDADGCHADIEFALNTGLALYPRWYPSCMSPGTTTREELQAYLYTSGSCPTLPCGYDAETQGCWNTCRNVQPRSVDSSDSACAEAVYQLMDPVSTLRPRNWHSCLLRGSTIDIQAWLAVQSSTLCPAPCSDTNNFCFMQPDTTFSHSTAAHDAVPEKVGSENKKFFSLAVVVFVGAAAVLVAALLLVCYRKATGRQKVVQGKVEIAVPAAHVSNGPPPLQPVEVIAYPVAGTGAGTGLLGEPEILPRKAQWEPLAEPDGQPRCLTPRSGGNHDSDAKTQSARVAVDFVHGDVPPGPPPSYSAGSTMQGP